MKNHMKIHIVALNVYEKINRKDELEIIKLSFTRKTPINAEDYCDKINCTNSNLEDKTGITSRIMTENKKHDIKFIYMGDSDDFDEVRFTSIEDTDTIVLNLFGENEKINGISFVVFSTCRDAMDYCKTMNKNNHDDKKWNYAKIIENDEVNYYKKPVPKDFNELEIICPDVIEIIASAFDPCGFPLINAISDNEIIINRMAEYEDFGSTSYSEIVHKHKSSIKKDEILSAKKQIMDYVMTLGFSK